VGNSPPLLVLWGDIPQTPCQGASPPGPPVCPPSWAEGLPAFWVPLVAGLLMWATRPSFGFWGTPPKPPARGLRPLDPPLPTPVGLGFASVLGPTRGGVANVGYSPPLLVFGGTPPTTPRQGACAPWTPRFPTLVGLGFASVLGPTRGGVANVGNSPPFKVLWGDTPHNPPPGGLRPLDPPLPTLPRREGGQGVRSEGGGV
jgi:hypothetical protein